MPVQGFTLSLPPDTGPNMQVILLEVVPQTEVRQIASADDVKARLYQVARQNCIMERYVI